MSKYSQKIQTLDFEYKQKVAMQKKLDELFERVKDLNQQYVVMLEAQQLLTTVANGNTTAVLDYITGVINKALGELFPYDTRRIYLEKSLHAGQHAHIKVKVENSEGYERDLTLQSGTGLRQVISFLFVISLIEIRKGRRILLMDELLSGLHPEAKRVVMDIVRIFADEGFQFIMVEYGVDDLGRLYLVEKPDKIGYVTPLDGKYNNEIFSFHRPAEEVDMNIQVDEGSEEEEG